MHLSASTTCLEDNKLSLQQSNVYQFPWLIYEPVFCGLRQKVWYEEDCVCVCVRAHACVHQKEYKTEMTSDN